jgi:iturin family lipopeptide synthetase A
MSAFQKKQRIPIAVIGMSCRLPLGIETPEELWKAFIGGKDACCRFADSRHKAWLGKSWGKHSAADFTTGASLLDRVDFFDAKFFGLSPREARRIDPQQRMLLEESWRALESAAIPAFSLRDKKAGVFIGISSDDYTTMTFDRSQAGFLDIYSGTGTHRSMAAGRIAHFLGLTGPIIQLDTACSSSLTAVHLACQSLQMEECELAIAAGAHVILDPRSVIARGMLQVLAPDGHCKPFSAQANGFGMGEGVVTFVLKPLDRAIHDENPIFGVIIGSAVGHNGRGAGLTVPNPHAQATVLREALERAEISPDTVVYVESHGTGTSLGDPIEIEALQETYGKRSRPLLVGSAKSNFGHLEAAAGGLSLMKAILALTHGAIPPNLHSATLNPHLDWEKLSIQVASEAVPWERMETPRRAGVSSFGMSGTNCHVILEEAPRRVPVRAEQPGPHLLVLSARSHGSLRSLAATYVQWFELESPNISDVARTLGEGRSHLEYRAGIVAQNISEARSLLQAIADGDSVNGVYEGAVFGGQKLVRVLLRVGRVSTSACARLAALCAAYSPLRNSVLACSAFVSNISQGLQVADLQLYLDLLGFVRLLKSWVKDLSIAPSDEFGELLVKGLHSCGDDRPGPTIDAEVTVLAGAELTIDLQSDFSSELLGIPKNSQALLEWLAYLYIHGANLYWKHICGFAGQKICLPVYPFEKQSFWIDLADDETEESIQKREESMSITPAKNTPISSIEADLLSFIAGVLEIDKTQLKTDQPLLQLGADSLTLAELVGFIDRQYGLQVALRQLFEELLSVRAIATYISEQPAKAPTSHATAPQATPPGSVTARIPVPVPEFVPEIPVKRPIAAAAPRQEVPAASSHQQPAPASRPMAPAMAVSSPRPASRKSENEHQPGTVQSQARKLTPAQLQCCERLVGRLNERTPGSAAEARRLRRIVCNNRRSLSQVSPETQLISYPIRAVQSKGSHFQDVDGNDYVDISMGYGVNFFGHSPDFIVDAIRRQLAIGMQLGPESDLLGEVAEGITQLTASERLLFCNSGTEAIMTAIRLARAATGRKTLVVFRNAYHGHFDGTLVNPRSSSDLMGQPLSLGTTEGMVADMLVLPYDSPRALAEIEAKAGQIAGVLVEPVQNRRPDLHPREFLHALRELTRRHHVPLIFDEILIGFRIHQKGGQGWFNVDADLVTYAKVIGGGMPIGVVAGRAAIMDRADGGFSYAQPGDPPPVESIYTAGTYCKHPLALAASRAIISELLQRGPALQETLNRRTDAFVQTVNDEMRALGVPITACNFGSFFRFAHNNNLSFVYQPLEMDLFNAGMIARGIYIAEGGTSFLSTAHTNEDVGRIVEAAVATAKEIREGGFWPEASSHAYTTRTPAGSMAGKTPANPRFSLSFFGAYSDESTPWSYDFTVKAARRAEELGFTALWFPERHFHEFGGLSPNPSLLAAAVSRETKTIGLRAGSVVAPLHHPVRIAEEWAIVDRLSGGRVEAAFASGWHTDDFVLAPEAFDRRRLIMEENIAMVQKLWSGKSVELPGPSGEKVEIRLYPRPIQAHLPIWLAALGHIETFEKAGLMGAGVLTNLITQNIGELREKIAAYRAALQRAGHPQESGRVAVLMHTFLAEDTATARQLATAPLKRYLESSVDLATRMVQLGRARGIAELSEEDRHFLFDQAVNRYIDRHSLIGSVESCESVMSELVKAGVDEIAAFIDFGVDADAVIKGLEHLSNLQQRWQAKPGQAPALPVAAASAKLERAETVQAAEAPPQFTLHTTSNQQILLHASQLDATAYQIRTTLELAGTTLDVAALERALQRVVDRHEGLRATFPGDDGDRQQISGHVPVKLRVLDITAFSSEKRDRMVSQWFDADSRDPLDIEKGPVFRFTVLRPESARYLLVITVHHVVYDGIAEQILVDETARFYNAEIGKDAASPGEAESYSAALQASLQDETSLTGDNLEFWKNMLAGVPPLSLPFDKALPQVKTASGQRRRTKIRADVRNAFKRIAAENLTTPFVLVLAAYTAFLHELCRADEILVGISINHRQRRRHRALIANCANMLPVRSILRENLQFIEHLRNMRQTVLAIYEHSHVPFAQLILKFGNPSWSAPPLVATAFNWDHMEPPSFGNVQAVLRADPATSVRFPLSLNVAETDGEWYLEWDFNSDLFDEQSITGFAEHFSSLLSAISESNAELVLHSPSSSPLKSICDRIVEQCRQRGPAVAVQDEHGTLTYTELDRRSQAVANRLRSMNLERGSVVTLRLPAGADSVVAILGIWKAGAAFAALDHTAPMQWTEELIRRMRAKIVITLPGGPQPKTQAAVMVLQDEEVEDQQAGIPEPLHGEDLAYVICTSGTTGEPKCIAVTHANLGSYLDAIRQTLNWNAAGDFLLVSPLHVDLGYTALFPPLAGGGVLHIASEQIVRDPGGFAGFLRRDPVDYLKITPTHLAALLEHEEARTMLPRKIVVLGGEPLPWELVDRLWNLMPDLEIFNHYGPAETTIGVAVYQVQKNDPHRTCATVPIGFALPQAKLSIGEVDGALANEGELIVEGAAVARGYLQLDGSLAPFVKDPSKAGRRYATGDIVRRMPDGALIFLHRRDGQIKVRGFRVDLGHVRNTILSYHGISDAQLVANKEKSALTCWLALRRSAVVDILSLSQYLEERLPDFMRPGTFVLIDKMPTTKSGKVDIGRLQKWTWRRSNGTNGTESASLPEQTTGLRKANGAKREHALGASSLGVNPSGEKLQQMMRLWREVLPHDGLRQDQSFFDMGGNSITAIRIIGRIRRAYGINVGIRTLFQYPTPASLLGFIEERLTNPMEHSDQSRQSNNLAEAMQ